MSNTNDELGRVAATYASKYHEAKREVSRLRDTQRVLVEALRKIESRCNTYDKNYRVASAGNTARAATPE